jgi:surface protein
MNNMFANCKNLISLNINNFYTPRVIDINHIFADCISLLYVNFNNFITSAVTANSICHIFSFNSQCKSNIRYCMDKSKASKFTPYINYTYIKDCSNICLTDPKYKYEYNNYCYIS